MVKKILHWYYGKASIRKKLVISYLLLMAVPVLVLGTYAYHNAKSNLLYQTAATMKNNVATLANDIEGKLSRENDNIKYLSYNGIFRRALQNASTDKIGLAQVLNESVEPAFWYFITSDENLRSIEIFSGHVQSEIGSFLKPYSICEGEPWADCHKNHYDTQWTFEDGELFASRTLLDPETSSRPIGIMKISVYPDKIISAVLQNDYLNNGVLLVDGNDRVIYSREVTREGLQEQIRNDIREGASDSAGKGDAKRHGYLLTAAQIAETDWTLYYFIDQDEILGAVYNILRSTLLTVGILLVFMIILISLLSGVLGKRILDLKKAAELVADGNFEIRVPLFDTDEIGVVAQSLFTMSVRLDEMIKENYELGKKRRAAELKALQAMINPHFLYNCLSGIKWKAIQADQEEISEVTGLLAKFYRTTLNGGKQITTVKNELDNIRAYLELQKMTHDGGFTVEYRISGEGQELSMPNFLLQPIVENAICHGIDYTDENKEGFIIVEYEKDEEFLLFRICNNGPEMELVQLQTILDTPGKGYGIYNIQERIQMYYGRECGIYAGISEEGYTCFTVKLKTEMEHPA